MNDDDSTEVAAGGLHHIAIRTDDVEGVAEFYRDVLDLRIVRDQRPRSLWLGLGRDSVLMIEARERSEPDVPAGSRELFALRTTTAGRRRIAEKARRLGCHDGETEHTVYLRDPDGRRVGASAYPLAALAGGEDERDG